MNTTSDYASVVLGRVQFVCVHMGGGWLVERSGNILVVQECSAQRHLQREISESS